MFISFKYFASSVCSMSRRKSGFRKKTRDKISKSVRERSKFTVNRLLTHYTSGERVLLKIDPAFHRGMFLPRFHGRNGVVQGTQGKCYVVQMMDGNKEKTLVVHPAHLRKF